MNKHLVDPSTSKQPFSTFPTVDERVTESTEIWARDVRALFEHAKDRYGDVSWESEDAGDERIWGHKAVIYARAPKAFKDRYFISRPFSRSPTAQSASSPHLLPPLFPRGTPSPNSFLSVQRNGDNLGLGLGRIGSSLSVGESFVSENTVKGGDGVMRLTHGDTPELFRAQLEWIYTGEGFGDVVEWISAENESGDLLGGSVRDSLGRRGNLADRRDKLGQDLTYMWRSKLYADVRIHLKPQIEQDVESDSSDSSTDSLSSTAVFTSHRFILTSRSPYFASVLLNPSSFRPTTDDIHLPTPPFTPAALHFCLGYMYAGHLDFSNRSFDLVTAFQIHRAAAYLQLDTLINEVEARIVHDFCHGLDKCHCKKCPQRAARVWRFASASDVGAISLAVRARSYVVKYWGESWGREVCGADQKERETLVEDVISEIVPSNVISSFRSLDSIRRRMDAEIRAKGRARVEWVDTLETMVEAVEKHARDIVISRFSVIADGAELWGLVSGNGFSGDVLERVMLEIVDGVGTAKGCIEGPRIYQALVSSILLKVDPDTLQTALPTRSRTRQIIETAKNGVLGHIKRRWMQIRDAGVFSELENWSLKEISDEIDVPVEDLLASTMPKKAISSRPLPRTTSRITSLSDAASIGSTRTRASMSSRPSTLRLPTSAPTPPEPSTGLKRLRLSSSASTSSAKSTPRSIPPPRPSLPAGPSSQPQARSPTAAKAGTVVPLGSVRARVAAANRATSSSPTPTSRPSPAPRPTMTGGPKPLLARAQPNPESNRPASIASVKTTRSTATAKTPVKPTISTKVPPLPVASIKTPQTRTRTSSMSTTASVRSRAVSTISKAPSVVGKASPATNKLPANKTPTPKPPLPRPTPSKVSPRTTFPAARTPIQPPPPGLSSATANRLRNLSTASSASKASIRKAPSKPALRSPSGSTDDAQEATTPLQSQIVDEPRIIIRDESNTSESNPASPPSIIPKQKSLPPPVSLPRTTRKTSNSSTTSFSGLRPHPASAFDPPKERPRPKFPPVIAITDDSVPFTGHGVALHVGIPCIVSLSSKRARFKANIKYLGHMAGSKGPWVGIELEDLDRLDLKTFPSGSKNGIHYFHLSQPDLTDENHDEIRQARRRRIDVIAESIKRSPNKLGTGMGLGLGLPKDRRLEGKRSLSPFGQGDLGVLGFQNPRAMFVRPSEVVFVLGAE